MKVWQEDPIIFCSELYVYVAFESAATDQQFSGGAAESSSPRFPAEAKEKASDDNQNEHTCND